MKPNRHAPALRLLLRSVVASASEWQGIGFRAVGTEYANKRDLLSGQGAKRYGGRWTPPESFATIHASLDVRTALAEALGTQEFYGIIVAARLPIALVAIDLHLQKVLDLTDASVLAMLKLTRRRLLRCPWRRQMDQGREPLTQALGRLAFELGIEGMFVPSAQARQGRNMVIFPDNLHAGSGLAIQNVHKLPPILD